MGTATALECVHEKIVDKPFLLIAPVLDYLDNLVGSIQRSGYSMRLFNSVVSKVEQEYNHTLASIDPITKLQKRNAATTIVHDPLDRFAKYTESEKAAKNMSRVSLVTANGQGHGRIMKSQYVMEAFDQLTKV